MENTIRKLEWASLCKILKNDDDMMIDKRTSRVLGPETDYVCYYDKF